ncbi:NTP transferase domain-containing protein [Candidatus Woesearchaeota archaeon]|nr:NTP transferase domain-containing protein [Candidatus Woesearchaeota archaeon]
MTITKQAVILAAGKSTRCYPLTITRPKSMLTVAGKTIIEHSLDQLVGVVEEAIIIVGYKKEMLIEFLGKEYRGLKISYVEQKEQGGTAHALLQAEKAVKSDFLALYGDDIYFKEDIKELTKHKFAILAKEHEEPQRFGVVEHTNGKLIEIAEKPRKPKSNLINIGVYKLNSAIFDIIRQTEKSVRAEIELPDAVNALAKKDKVEVVQAKNWLPNGYPWDLLETNSALLANLLKTGKNQIKGTVEKGATLKGTIILGKNSIIKAGSYIEGNVFIGENTTIGPNCYIRGSTSIGDNCKIGQSVEIKNSIIMNNSKVPHLSYVGDSIIGEHVNIGAGTIIANLRHDKTNIKSMVKDKLVDTGRHKFGAVIGDNVNTGINTTIYPGRIMWPGKSTLPGESVIKDIK